MNRTHSRHTLAQLALCLSISIVAALVAAACSKSPAAPAPTCVITLGQVTTAIAAGGTTASVAVNTSAGCAWTATSGATFITITQGATGNGSGTVQFTVAPNIGGARTGTLTVGETTITFTQAAGIVITPTTLAPPNAQSPAGGQVVDTVTPTLVVANAAATGNVGPVTYRFEVSDQGSFPDGVRTIAADDVPQGSGNTAWTVPQSLAPGTMYFWRARANGASISSAFSNVETFRTPSGCSFSLSTTTIPITSAGGTATVGITAPGGCSWTAASNAPFITITSGAFGAGNGTVAISVAPSGGVGRSGTLTIAGQTVTVNQAGSSVVASFNLLDPSTTAGPTNECRFRSLTSTPTTCTLTSTSFPLGPTSIVNYAWTVKYTYVTEKTLTQTGSNPQFTITDVCGLVSSTPEGATQPLEVTLTVTDSAGSTATATSGTGTQPALQVRLFTCGI